MCVVFETERIRMGKKKAGGGAGLGRALIKERLQAGRGNKRNDTWVLEVIHDGKISLYFFRLRNFCSKAPSLPHV